MVTSTQEVIVEEPRKAVMHVALFHMMLLTLNSLTDRLVDNPSQVHKQHEGDDTISVPPSHRCSATQERILNR